MFTYKKENGELIPYVNGKDVVTVNAQSFTDSEKEQVRNNIGAGSLEDVASNTSTLNAILDTNPITREINVKEANNAINAIQKDVFTYYGFTMDSKGVLKANGVIVPQKELVYTDDGEVHSESKPIDLYSKGIDFGDIIEIEYTCNVENELHRGFVKCNVEYTTNIPIIIAKNYGYNSSTGFINQDLTTMNFIVDSGYVSGGGHKINLYVDNYGSKLHTYGDVNGGSTNDGGGATLNAKSYITSFNALYEGSGNSYYLNIENIWKVIE